MEFFQSLSHFCQSVFSLTVSWPTMLCIPTLTAVVSVIVIAIKVYRSPAYPQTDTHILTQKDNNAPIVLDNILTRRTIFPKDCLENKTITNHELEMILEAANWAPTHNKTEPWRYIIFQGPEAILSYLDFLEDFYLSKEHIISENEMEKFRKKMSGARKDWPEKCACLIVIAMKRQQPDENGSRMPEWEEICAVAMSVQNMHLMATGMNDIAGFWSSHTWCKRARDSEEMRSFLHLSGEEDRVFGAFLLGRYDTKHKRKFRSSRTPIWDKVEIIKS